MAVFPLNDEIRTFPAVRVPDRRTIASGATKHAAAVLKSEVNGYEGVLSRS